jgi:AraC-like DNA-binding protein
MLSLTDIAVLLALSQLITVSISFLFFSQGFEGRLIGVLSACLGCYVLGDFSALTTSPLLSYLVFRIGTLTPFVLWYLAFRLFTDNVKLNRLFWVPILYFIVSRAVGVPFYNNSLTNSDLYFLLIYAIPQLILVCYACLAILLAVQGYRADLVEERRRFRVIFVVSVGAFLAIRGLNSFFTFADPFLESFSLFSRTPVPSALFPLYLFLLGLVFNLSVLRVSNRTLNVLTEPGPAPPPEGGPVAIPSDNQNHLLMNRVLELVANQRLFSQHGLTITTLAEQLGVQEYRLRRLINKELKFKNFNQFLNSYRLTEASSRLVADNSSISSIALDVGFTSMSSFNTAFKTRFGMTPTEYRNRHRARDGQGVPTE